MADEVETNKNVLPDNLDKIAETENGVNIIEESAEKGMCSKSSNSHILKACFKFWYTSTLIGNSLRLKIGNTLH